MRRRSFTNARPAIGRAVVFLLFAGCVGVLSGSASSAPGHPAPPHGLKVRSISNTSVQVSWAAARGANRAVGYRIYVNGSLRSAVRATSYRLVGLRCGTNYVVAVRAYDARGRTSKLRSLRVSTTRCGGGCFANPGSCGYPDPARGTVGVPAGTTLKPSGSIKVTTAGTVISGMDIAGFITVSANNVTIQNSRITMVGGGCGPTSPCGNADIRLTCACTVTISHVELTTDAGTTVEHAIRNSYDGTILVDHVYQHGNTDALCWCGNATIRDSYSTIHLAMSDDHLENLYIDGFTDDIEHNTFINEQTQTANIFGNTNNGSGGACSNRLTVTNNLMAGGGYTIYPCGNANSVGSATLVFESNMIARCGHGRQVEGDGGTWLCAGGADQNGLYPRGGSFGPVSAEFCGRAGWTWTNNVWSDGGTISC